MRYRKFMVMVLVATMLLGVAGMTAAESPSMDVGAISGRVMISGKAEASGWVYLYSLETGAPPDASRYIRTPDWIGFIHPGGEWSVTAAPGEYFLEVVFGEGDVSKGRWPRSDDEVYLASEGGVAHLFRVAKNEKRGVGEIQVRRMPEELDTMRMTGISGMVVDAVGKPVAGVRVAAYEDMNASMPPVYLSRPTDEDGRFLLGIAGEGVVYLHVVPLFMEQSLAGSGAVQVGYFGDSQPSPVDLIQGEMAPGIRIRIQEMPIAEWKGRNSEAAEPADVLASGLMGAGVMRARMGQGMARH